MTSGPVLITGGAGFVGCNLADEILSRGRRVVIYDNLSRAGVKRNAEWLQHQHGSRVLVQQADIRDAKTLDAAVRSSSAVFHLAAQVAVTSSLLDPEHDFHVNALGTLNVLQSLRRMDDPAPLVFTSTNKVYGRLQNVALRKKSSSYQPEDSRLRAEGINEAQPLDFCSPYGCSKGAADQYVLDHAKAYGLKATVFRMSCIYGPHQFGTEDQGWLAHFLIQARKGQPITIYGDGHQVRDVLFVEDLVRAFLLAEQKIATLSGEPFNIGGGPERAVSLLEAIAEIARLGVGTPAVVHEEWRMGDQPYYVSDTAKFREATGWKPSIGLREGLRRLNLWMSKDVDPVRGSKLASTH